MKTVLFGFLMLVVGSFFPGHQDKPVTSSQAPLTVAKSAGPPVASEKAKNNFLLAQRAADRLQNDFKACQQRNWGQDFAAQGQSFQAAIDAVFADAKVSKDDWEWNTETLVFSAKAKPAAPATKEDKKPN